MNELIIISETGLDMGHQSNINFALDTPAEVANRHGKQNPPIPGRIWKMTKCFSNPAIIFNHYKTLNENHIPDGDKVVLKEV